MFHSYLFLLLFFLSGIVIFDDSFFDDFIRNDDDYYIKNDDDDFIRNDDDLFLNKNNLRK